MSQPSYRPPALASLDGAREVIDGRYELVDVLGRGGMGTVYRAIQRPIEREVAVKVLRRGFGGEEDRRATRRFLKEARTIAGLHHPHVITLYDFGETERGDLYIAMELLPGRSLAELLVSGGAMPLARVVHVVDQVLDALHEAHVHGIVHRDLKPENIQVGRRGEIEDFVTVLDFGIARDTRREGVSSSSTTIEVAGTPAYMSPEQILGSAIDPRSDLYAVGVLLFELLTARTPFVTERGVEMYTAHLRTAPPRLKDVAPALGTVAGLQDLLDRSLAKAPADRFGDASAFRRALRSVGGMAPLGARRQTTGRASGVASVNDDGAQQPTGFELVAAIEPADAPGAGELLEQWALDLAEHGGTVRERRPGQIHASFPVTQSVTAALRAALAMKARTRTQRQATFRALYLRVGIHAHRDVASRLCEEAPRGSIYVGDACLGGRDADVADLRFEPSGELRIRGLGKPVRMLQLLSGR